MIEHIRDLITESYNLFHSSPEFAMIRTATFKERYIDDDFLRLTKELAILKTDLREELSELSSTIEEMEGVVNEFKLLIARKQENIRNTRTKIN